MGKAKDRFLSTLSIISRIPVKQKFNFYPSGMDYWLPVTGLFPALLGLLLFTGFSFFAGDPFIAVIVTLTAQYLCFNLFHLDGLMDTADAFLGTVDREKRLAILKDSRTGVYGFFSGFAALSLKAAFLRVIFTMNQPALAGGTPGGFSPDAFLLSAVFLAFPLFGRFSAALIPCMAKPAIPGGLGAVMKDARPLRGTAGIITALICWGLCVLGWRALISLGALRFAAAGISPGTALPSLPAALALARILPAFIYTGVCLVLISPLTAWFYARLYRNSLGGYTGDALGAAIESAEILSLAVSAVSGYLGCYRF
ncbi:MAG: adenosylcobinamide-GDP ribazoletransferase [Treponema sp.]|jgi:adenosylcobinamide-GDP ribazoletransferase|nr:adenosylcobinamide-GDP ribazoletransferase [Treponema sp.]